VNLVDVLRYGVWHLVEGLLHGNVQLSEALRCGIVHLVDGQRYKA